MIEIELLNPPAIEVDLSDAMQGPAGPPGNQQASPANTLIGNATGATANPTALAPSAVKAMLGYTTQAEVDAALLAAIQAELADIDGGTPSTTFTEEIDGGTP